MDELLKLLFEKILTKQDEMKEIKSAKDLSKATIFTADLVRIFAALNDDMEAWSTEEILNIANEVYKEKYYV